jgi:hypothetical protein
MTSHSEREARLLEDIRERHQENLTLQAEVSQLKREVTALKGVEPKLPPRPPEGNALPRYGIKWNGDNTPITIPLNDGYWTPFHLAEKALDSANVAAAASLIGYVSQQEDVDAIQPLVDASFKWLQMQTKNE